MKNLLLASLLFLSTAASADSLKDTLNRVEAEWAKIYYSLPKAAKSGAYAKLLEETANASRQYPKDMGLIFWQAVVKASHADHQDPVSALQSVHEVRSLLTKVITVDPKTVDGSAYVVLGTLYHKVPAWPVAFGDDIEAEKMLKMALTISPNGIDSNFYYGEFLIDKGQDKVAEAYFERASSAPIRPEQIFADSQLQNEAKQVLSKLRGR
jgi:hypothetical protein